MSSPMMLVLMSCLMVAVVKTDQGRPVERFIMGQYTRGACEVEGHYPRDSLSFDRFETTRRYNLSHTWSDRCSNCTCTTAGAACLGPRCEQPYDFTQEHWCLQWSEDGCCCERLGCTVDGQQYSIGETFPYDSENPCLTCSCQIGWSKAQCLMQKCNTVELTCQERLVIYHPTTCCPVYICPHGVTCDVIPDPFPDTPRHELLDWYGGHLDPIHQGMTQHFHLDSWSSYVCSCETGGTANCEMKTFGMS